jgi:alkylation response protein AidB-like acyl-CoA dehydrogenase
MRFGLSEEHVLLRDNVTRYLSEHATLDRIRGVADGDRAAADAITQGLLELGIGSLLVPETYGGLGLGVFEAAVVAEAMGTAVAPVPFVASCAMAPIAFARGGSERQKREWLPRIATGQTRIGVGLSEHVGARDGAGIEHTGGKLHGTALFVLDADAADAYLIVDRRRNLYLVAAEDVRRTELITIDRTRAVAELSCAGTPAEVLAAGDVALPHMLDAGRVLLAADTVGAAQAMLNRAVRYAGERHQFGRPVGSFQAVKHMCAEMAAELEPTRALVWYAAHCQDAIPTEARLMSCHAKAHAGEVGRFVAKTATEVHGGMGFTDMLGLHYWFKRIGFDRQVLGTPEQLRDEAARIQGWI